MNLATVLSHITTLSSRLSGFKGFGYFNFSFEYLKRLQSSKLLHTKMPLIILLVGRTGCMGAIFSTKMFSKNGRESTIVGRIFEGPTIRNPNQNRAALWQIFPTNKSATANRKNGF
jgi:hypothetical protein